MKFSIKYIGLYCAVALASALFYPLLVNPGPGVGVDLPAWTAIGHLLRTEILPDQGWFVGVLSPEFSAGQEIGNWYSLNLMILWLLNLLMSPDLAAKLPCVLTAVVLASGIYRVAVRFAHPAIAGLGGFLSVLLSGQLILQGMWYDILSLGLAFHMWSLLQAPGKTWTAKRWLVITLLYGATIYAHPMGLIAATVIWSTTLLALLADKKKTGEVQASMLVAAILPCALMLGAPQIMGLLSQAHGAARFVQIDWATGLLRLLEVGDLRMSLGRIALTMIVLLFGGILLHLASLRHLPKDFLLTIAALGSLTAVIMVERPLVFLVDCCHIPFLGTLASFGDRFTHLWGPLVILLFCVLLGVRISATALTERLIPSKPLFIFSLFVATSLLSIFLSAELLRSPFQLTLGVIRERTELLAVWSWLNANRPEPGTRVCLEPTFKGYQISGEGNWSGVVTNRTHVFSLTPIFVSGMNQISGSMYGGRFAKLYAGTSGSFMEVDVSMGENGIQALSERMARLRCRYAVAHSEPARVLLSQMLSLQVAFQSGGITVYRHNLQQPPADSGLRIVAVDSARYRLVHSERGLQSVILPLAYSAQWRATMSGVSLILDEEQGLLRVNLPADLKIGEGELTFGSDQHRNASLFIFVLGIVASLAIAAVLTRNGRAGLNYKI